MQTNWQKAEKILKNDGVVVLPTDTLYGIIGKAMSKKAVDIIYKIKERNNKKPFILLINSYKNLNKFGVKLNKEQAKFLEKIWPGKVSVILSCKNPKWKYIHLGTNSIAFRMISPKCKNLYNLINKVGPLVAPSANLEGKKPAETIDEAKKYFENKIDLYISSGRRKQNPSRLISYLNKKPVVLRK